MTMNPTSIGSEELTMISNRTLPELSVPFSIATDGLRIILMST
mgnify:CR=1 FL=1